MRAEKRFVMACVFTVLVLAATPAAAQSSPPPGSSPATALENCQALYSAGVALSGTYWINPLGTGPRTAYCDMETNGGGWTLVYNSVLGTSVTEFWNISHWERFNRRGRPDINALFYDGSFYQYGRAYMDVIEDLRGKIVVVLVARASGIDTYSMRFINPVYVSGHPGIYTEQFASGWSSPDFDGDMWSNRCATYYSNVTQHYGSCWYYNLGSDEDAPTTERAGPHIYHPTAAAIGIATDGTPSSRVRRISRFTKW